ncbi:hypothetical protein ACQCSX_04350 [Pseudarthrobacter sp. P1]|uniref:hypothetical protein n=1 Tax=Pseudarthrobacter sp. P1 TaxID=3418418 RepID=UPI003CF3ADE9
MADRSSRAGYATTTDDLEWLLRLGLPVEVVAARMGRSVEAVVKMIEGNQA